MTKKCKVGIKMKKVVLLGNPNSGKTTLFNTLTKSNRTTGNRFGVTVDIGSCICTLGKTKTEIIDVPGIYSLTPFSEEEKEVTSFLNKGSYDSIILVINSLNPLRSFNLLNECLKLNKPITAALNFCDEFTKRGIEIDIDYLKREYGCGFVKISSSKNRGLDELLQQVKIEKQIDYTKKTNTEKIISSAFKMKKRSGSYKPDKIFTEKYTAFPVLFLFTLLMFTFVFSGVCAKASEFLNGLITVNLYELLKSKSALIYTNTLLTSLLCDGVLQGVGTVVAFLPQIVSLSFILSLFEDSGYLSRCAYICDKPLSKIGLQGKCFFCVMMGFGCTVPALLSTRVLENKSDRIKTIILDMFIPCSAKIPLIVLFCSVFFKGNILFICCVYTFVLVTGIIYLYIIRKKEKEKTNLFLLELPEYRIPAIKSIYYSVKSKTKDFLFKAGTVLIITSVIIWFVSNFNTEFKLSENDADTISSFLGQKLLFIFRPLGLCDWKQTVSLISGVFAREGIVSSLNILYKNNIADAFSKASALSFCLFTLLFPPCIASLITALKELKNNKLFIKIIAFQAVLAYIICILVYQIGRWIL